MSTKVLLAGLIGFFLGGLLVAIAATTFENDRLQRTHDQVQSAQR